MCVTLYFLYYFGFCVCEEVVFWFGCVVFDWLPLVVVIGSSKEGFLNDQKTRSVREEEKLEETGEKTRQPRNNDASAGVLRLLTGLLLR